MVVLTTGGAGFHTLSPLGTPLAPNVFLNSALNPSGRIVGDPATGWETTDSLSRADYGISIHNGTFAQTGPQTGTLHVHQITYTRVEHGVEVEIGRMTIDPPLSIEMTATVDDTGHQNGWTGALAAALEDAVQAEGLRFEGGDGIDVFDPAAEILPIRGPVELYGRGGDDWFATGRTDDLLRGGKGDDHLESSGGTDLLRGGGGADRLVLGTYSEHSVARGGRGDDWLTSSNGDDHLLGGDGRDRLDGGRGADRLGGGKGADTLDGGEGDDRLTGGAGNDRMTGGWGADSFVFKPQHTGHDLITDFDLGDGDQIVFADGVPHDLSVEQRGDDLVLSWHNGDATVTLEGVDIADTWDALGL